MVKCDSTLTIFSGRRVALGWPRVTVAPGWILRVMNFSEKALDSLDTCHHSDGGQILTTIDAPCFPICQRGKSEKRGY